MNFDDISLEKARQSRSYKWTKYGNEIIPSWIADMDFPAADPIRKYLHSLGESGDLCYVPEPPLDPLLEVFSTRMKDRFGWLPAPEDMECMTDIVQGIYIAVKVLCADDEKVIVNTPAYHPILNACKDMKRDIFDCPLNKCVSETGKPGWQIDFDRLEREIDPKTRLLLLVNPHNPTGRAFNRDELEKIADIVRRHNLWVVSDEIHCDLIFPGSGPHIPFATIGEDVAQRTVTFNSASKSHNLGATRCSIAHYGCAELKTKFDQLPRGIRGGANAVGPRISKIAWQECGDWFEYVLAYLDSNNKYMIDFFKSELPEIDYIPNEATYLAWLDFNRTELAEDPANFLLRKAGVAAYSGLMFGEQGKGHIRLNFATSRPILQEKLRRIRDAILER